MEFIRCILKNKNNYQNITEIDVAINTIENINVDDEKNNSYSFHIWAGKNIKLYEYVFKDKEDALEALMNL